MSPAAPCEADRSVQWRMDPPPVQEPAAGGTRAARRARRRLWLLAVLVAAGSAGAGWLSHAWWRGTAAGAAAGVTPAAAKSASSTGSHTGHGPATTATCSLDTGDSLLLSALAQKNVGLTTVKIELRDFDRTVSVPAMVVEQSGRSQIAVSAPMGGIVAHIYPIRGEAVEPGAPLFDLRLTDEQLVATQTSFLQTREQLDVITKEVVRLEQVTSRGAVAGKQLLDRQYGCDRSLARVAPHGQASPGPARALAGRGVDPHSGGLCRRIDRGLLGRAACGRVLGLGADSQFNFYCRSKRPCHYLKHSPTRTSC